MQICFLSLKVPICTILTVLGIICNDTYWMYFMVGQHEIVINCLFLEFFI